MWRTSTCPPSTSEETEEGGLRFTGEAAIAAHAEVFPDLAAADEFSDLGVPVEPGDGLDGSSRSHWDEAVLGDREPMTPTPEGPDGGPGPLTDLTVASPADLGHEVADPGMLLGRRRRVGVGGR